jgi:hypothetical protein
MLQGGVIGAVLLGDLVLGSARWDVTGGYVWLAA